MNGQEALWQKEQTVNCHTPGVQVGLYHVVQSLDESHSPGLGFFPYLYIMGFLWPLLFSLTFILHDCHTKLHLRAKVILKTLWLHAAFWLILEGRRKNCLFNFVQIPWIKIMFLHYSFGITLQVALKIIILLLGLSFCVLISFWRQTAWSLNSCYAEREALGTIISCPRNGWKISFSVD